ncbi:MAG: CBS domain-containing protein [Methanosarcinales archaeon]|nr:MAG: CBS domain-containing protein [Methanosarcinales archaeon]
MNRTGEQNKMKWSYQIGSIRGIPIRLHVTFLLILIFFIGGFAVNDITIEKYGIIIGFDGLDASTVVKYLFSMVTAVLFFSTLLFHELSHSIVAQGYGIKIKSITLFIIGGVAQMEDIPKEPRMEAWISVAGPAFSLAIGIITYTIYDFFGQVSSEGGALENGVLIMLGIIAFYNIVLGIFNLIPAFPMDGGRIFRALLATRISYISATRKAVAIGKGMAFMMGIVGLLTLPDGIWFILIAFFIYYGAAGEGEATTISITLEGLKVRDLMTGLPDVVHALPDWTLNQLIDVMFKTKHMGYPVQKSPASPVLGVITFADVRRTPEQRGVIRVSDVMTSEIISIEAEADAFDAFKLIASEGVGRLIVMDHGRMTGIVSRTDLLRSVQFRGAYRGDSV